jgi:hypothetical protein
LNRGVLLGDQVGLAKTVEARIQLPIVGRSEGASDSAGYPTEAMGDWTCRQVPIPSVILEGNKARVEIAGAWQSPLMTEAEGVERIV